MTEKGGVDASTVLCAVYDGLADWEPGYVVAGVNDPQGQREPGRYRVRTVGVTGEPVTTIGGIRILPDLALGDIDPARAAFLVLPGAEGWLAPERPLAEFARAARRVLDAGGGVGAICGATVGIAQEGLLDERDHTSNAPEQLTLAPEYAGHDRYRPERAVRDGRLVTAGGVSPLQFAHAVFEELGLYDPDVLDAWYRLQLTGDPVWFHRLMEAVG